MPDAGNNSTKSRLSEFIKGCTQLKEIYAVAPLDYTNIMGEWWQRINDLIYTLGLTETHDTPVTIAWTVPVPGRKRSPFFEEEIATKKPDGTDVSENSRVSGVAGTGTTFDGTNTKKIKAHKYGLVQSIDKLFQRNIDTWGNLYQYFYNKTHNSDNTLKTGNSIGKPADISEMLFGEKGKTDSGTDETFSRACRNLHKNAQGLANSLTHVIEDIFNSEFYDWLDNLSTIESEPRPNGLSEFFFGNSNNFSSIWGRMTTGGVIAETVKLIDTLGNDFYEWLNNPLKTCSIASTSSVYHLYKRTNGNWARINSNTEYTYRGKTTVRYTLDYPKFGSAEAPMLFSSTLTSSSMSYKDDPESNVAIALVYGDSTVNTNEIALKREFVKYAVNGTGTEQAPVSIIVPSPKANDVVYVGVRMLINKDTAFEFEITKIGLFVYNGTTWNLIEDTYGTIIPGIFKDVAYAAPAPATAAERRVVKTCLIEIVNTEIDESNHYPKTLMDVLFGPDSENKICDMWKEISTGSIIKENLLIKETIGEDLINLLNGDSVDGITEPRPHSLKEMLFGSMSIEEIYNKFQTLSSKSVFEEITNITNYLGDSYNQYITNNTYIQSGQAETPVNPTSNPMAAQLADGQSIVASEDGKLHVDFTNMPTDKFEALLSALKMQIPLEDNLHLYVDINNPNADDTIVSGRGTPSLPFKSISACINYATQKYALGNHDVWIHIKEGIYYTPTEIVLPYFTRTSGSFYLISEDGYGKAIVRNSSPQNTIFYSSGGSWHFIGLAMELTTTTVDDGYPYHPACLVALYGPDIFIESCKFISRYIGERTSNSVISIRGVAIDLSSNLYIVPNNMGPTTFHVEQGNVPYNGNYAIYVAQNSHAYFMSTNTPEINNAYNVYFSGKMTHVFLVGAASAACTWGGALYSTKPAQNPNSSLDAQTYRINGSSYMAFGNYMLLPKTGYIDESTYCWYR